MTCCIFGRWGDGKFIIIILEFLTHTCDLALCLHPSMHSSVDKIPAGPKTKVFLGVAVIVGGCAIPVFGKNEKSGHDLFSQEKPEAVTASIEQLQRKHYSHQQAGSE